MSNTVAAVGNKLDLLDAVPDTEKSKSGSKSPVVFIDAALEAKLTEIRELKTALKDAEGHLALLFADVLPVAEKLRRDLCVKEQKHLSSISLGGTVVFVIQNKYAGMPMSEESRLRAIFNGAFESYFARKVTLTVDVDKLSAETVARLVQDGAATKCEVLKPTDVFHASRSTDPGVAMLADNAGLKPVTFLKF
jgi:hypothetical protein